MSRRRGRLAVAALLLFLALATKVTGSNRNSEISSSESSSSSSEGTSSSESSSSDSNSDSAAYSLPAQDASSSVPVGSNDYANVSLVLRSLQSRQSSSEDDHGFHWVPVFPTEHHTLNAVSPSNPESAPRSSAQSSSSIPRSSSTPQGHVSPLNASALPRAFSNGTKHNSVYVSVEPTGGDVYAPAEESPVFPFRKPPGTVEEGRSASGGQRLPAVRDFSSQGQGENRRRSDVLTPISAVDTRTTARTGEQRRPRRTGGPGAGGVPTDMQAAAETAYAQRFGVTPVEDVLDNAHGGRAPMSNERTRSSENASASSVPVRTVRFRECLDAQTRGYSMPFACCTLRDGDFYDPNIWHCGRVPTMLDAVFIRHFVRIDDGGEPEIRVRALWVIESIEPKYRKTMGLLRGGMVVGQLCAAAAAGGRSASPPPREYLEGFRRNFRLLLSQRSDVVGRGSSRASVSEICEAFTDSHDNFASEKDFDTSTIDRPVFIRVEDIGGPVPKDIAVSVAMTSVRAEPENSVDAGGATTFVNLPEFERLRQYLGRASTVAQQQRSRAREREQPARETQPPAMQNTDTGEDRGTLRSRSASSVNGSSADASSDVLEKDDAVERSSANNTGDEEPFGNDRNATTGEATQVQRSDRTDGREVSADEGVQTSRKIKEGGSRKDETEDDGTVEQGVPDFYATALSRYLPSMIELSDDVPQRLRKQEDEAERTPQERRLQTRGEEQRQSQPPNVRFAAPLKADGPVTLRVEKRGSLLLFENIAVNVEGDIRNEGTFFIGETILNECLRTHPESSGLCRVPSLVSAGSLIATEPINVMWLQLSQPRKPLPKASGADEDEEDKKYWYGIAQYPDDLPDNERSTLTLFGDIDVKRIIPGFSLSFKRVGFPPNPPPPGTPLPTTLTVKDTKETSDLVIYVDILDNDGFVDCCEQFHEEDVAEFVVRGTNLKLGRYTDFYKDIGDSDSKISEQIVLRAPTITTEQMFVDLPAVIPRSDAVLTNREKPYKMAGINRDIVFFQCTQECRISNQVFTRQDPYLTVEVKRELKKNRSSMKEF